MHVRFSTLTQHMWIIFPSQISSQQQVSAIQKNIRGQVQVARGLIRHGSICNLDKYAAVSLTVFWFCKGFKKTPHLNLFKYEVVLNSPQHTLPKLDSLPIYLYYTWGAGFSECSLGWKQNVNSVCSGFNQRPELRSQHRLVSGVASVEQIVRLPPLALPTEQCLTILWLPGTWTLGVSISASAPCLSQQALLP